MKVPATVATDEPITCLIADPHPLMRRAVAACLRAEPDVEVTGDVADGQALLPLVERRRPDAVIVEVDMPRLDGLGVCRALVRPHGVRVVLYTGNEDIDVLEAALEAGAAGYVLKSGAPAEIARALRVAVGGRVYIDAVLASTLIGRREQLPQNPFTSRELEVLALLADGHTTDEIAGTLFLSPATVRSYAEAAMRKLDARNRSHLVAKSLRAGLLR